MQTPAALKKARRELRARLNRLAQQERPDLAVCGELCRAIESLDKEIEQLQAAVTVAVYRKHQPGWTSPCQLEFILNANMVRAIVRFIFSEIRFSFACSVGSG